MNIDPDEPAVALVVAAGSGTRLGGGEPKALRLLAGVPLVRRSVDNLAAGGVRQVVITVAPGLQDRFAPALAGVQIPVELVEGGSQRQDSVRLGLAALGQASIVLVHDAARPLVPPPVVTRVIAAVREGHVAVIPALPMIDSVRRVDGDSSAVVDRSLLRGVQTPQGFHGPTLVAAHALIAERGLVVTDDAAACEVAGHPVHLVEGSRASIKITEPVDLAIAEALLAMGW